MRIFDSVADLQLQTLDTNQFVMIKGGTTPNDGGTKFFQIVGSGSGVYALANGNEAKPVAFAPISPTTYEAVGDGVTDDTTAVQACLDNERFVIIDKVFAVTSVTIPKDCYVTCIGDGMFKSVGITDSSCVRVEAETTGRLKVDGDNRAVNTIFFPEGLGYAQTYESIDYANIRMVVSASTTNTGVTMFGDEVTGGPIRGRNLDQNGYSNRSFPQGLLTGGGTYEIESHYLEDGSAGFVPVGLKTGETVFTASGKVTIGRNHTVRCTDNSAYLLGGYVDIGLNICEEEEESVQINACRGANIGKIITVGRCLGAFNLQNVLGDVNIGEIEGQVPVGTAPADYGTNCATVIGYVRPGNVDVGTQNVYIGRVSGVFQRAFTISSAGTVESFHVQGGDVELQYNTDNNPVNSWVDTTTDWLNFDAVKRPYIRDFNIRIRNRNAGAFPTFTSGNNFSWAVRTAGAGVEDGVVENLQVYLIENTGAQTDVNHVRGPIPTAEFRIYDGYWNNFGANTFWVSPRFANYVKNSINSIPQEGYWWKGEKLINRNYEYSVDDVASYHNMATGLVSGSANWQEEKGSAPQLAGSGTPVGSVTPQVRNQIYADTSTSSPRILWMSYGLTNTEWEQLN